jgi:parallel beta-helix repeat protein
MIRQQRRKAEREARKAGRKNVRHSWVGAALAVGAMGLALPGVTEGAAFKVTNKLDSGPGSLRNAVDQANANPGLDTISFARLSGAITLTSGQMGIYDSVRINGPGASKLTVSGNDASRIFWIPDTGYAGPTLDVTISGLTLTHGFDSGDGGAILQYDNNLTLNNMRLLNNRAGDQGGALWSDGDTTINNCTISGNSCGEDGGGIAIDGRLTMDKTVISDNSADDEGGGIFLDNLWSTTISSCTISGNSCASDGGGIYINDTDGWVLIKDTVISGNSSSDDGAGVYIDDTGYDDLAFRHCTISGNTAGSDGGGIFFAYGDGLFVDSCTISGNVADDDGGGVYFDYGDNAAVENTTISGNTAQGDGGGVYLDDEAHDPEFNFCTIAGNVAAYGGGIHADTPVYVDNSIIGDNTAWEADRDTSGSQFNLNFSLVENLDGASYNDNGGNWFDYDPQLKALADNGGLTKTMLLKSSSPAINRANPDSSSMPPTDQRRMARVKSGRADMGAVEKY